VLAHTSLVLAAAFREAAVRKATARAAEDEERSFVGRPRLTAKALRCDSKLRLGSAADAATYAQRVAQAAEQRQAKLDALQAATRLHEAESCTFAPAVRACPAYVARMADAHRHKLKVHGDAGGECAPRPDWK
jgi:hypothetical protein